MTVQGATRRVTEDGPERWCRACQEWWPDDRDFWWYFGTRKQTCRACQSHRTRVARDRRKVRVA